MIRKIRKVFLGGPSFHSKHGASGKAVSRIDVQTPCLEQVARVLAQRKCPCLSGEFTTEGAYICSCRSERCACAKTTTPMFV